MSDIGNQAAWSSVVSGLIYNSDTAIARYWAELKQAGQFIGVPTSDELPDPDTGGVQMSFSSGAVIAWDPTNGASLR
jgi:uncharacterized protein with LGFP repeats